MGCWLWTKRDEQFKPHRSPIFSKKRLCCPFGEVFEVYCNQLDKLSDALKEKRQKLVNWKCVVFHQDNARPHTSFMTRLKLLQLKWDVLPQPPYSPDLASSDYCLFWYLQNFLNVRNFTSSQDVKNHLNQFFASKDQKFYERGINLLLERWQKVLG